MPPGPGICIPAAGASARMRGRDKLTEPVGGVPLLRRQALFAADTGLPVLITLRADRPARRALLDDLSGITLQTVKDPDQGMSTSLRAATRWALSHRLSGLMVLPGDMPDLGTADLRALAEAFAEDPHSVLRAADQDGRPGHPVILPARLYAALLQVTGDDGGRSVIAPEPVRLYPLPGYRATTDLDTPEDWAAWHNRQ